MAMLDKYERMTDVQLLGQFQKSQSETAFKVLVDRHYRMIYGICVKSLQDSALACDATQATFIIFSRKAAKIKEPERLSGWLMGVARQVVLHVRRERMRRDKREKEAAAMVYSRNDDKRPAWDLLCVNLDEAIASLAPNLQEPVLRHFLGGKTRREVATELGASEKAVEHRIARGLEQLRKFFGAKGTAVSSATLLSFLSIQSAQAAPAGLATSCHLAAMQDLAGTLGNSGSCSIANSIMKKMFWAKAKTFVAVLGVSGLIGTGAGVAALNFLAPRGAPETPPPIQAQPKMTALPVNPDLSGKLEILGKPFAKGPYASNVWDMQLFNNRIYLGHGNCQDSSPESNAGPVPVIYLDPFTNQFVNDGGFVAQEEEINLYRIIDGKLYIPGLDPRESWELGNFYTLEASGWQKHRTIPKAIDTFDILRHQGKLFVVTNHRPPATSVMSSSDDGKTWKTYPELNPFYYKSIFTLKGVLYSIGQIPSRARYGFGPVIVEYNGLSFVKREDLNFQNLFPGENSKILYATIDRPINFAGGIVYFSGGWRLFENQCLFFASSLQKGNVEVCRAKLPEGTVPIDTIVRGNTLYLLLNKKIGQAPDAFSVSVLSTTDFEKWTELFHFTRPSFARSFEEFNGDFYFGMGTGTGKDGGRSSFTSKLEAESGTIIKISKGSYATGALGSNTGPSSRK